MKKLQSLAFGSLFICAFSLRAQEEKNIHVSPVINLEEVAEKARLIILKKFTALQDALAEIVDRHENTKITSTAESLPIKVMPEAAPSTTGSTIVIRSSLVANIMGSIKNHPYRTAALLGGMASTVAAIYLIYTKYQQVNAELFQAAQVEIQ